jgi:hypothetical protein
MDKTFWYATLIRALRTVCQTAVASIGSALVLTDVNWAVVVSASALAGLLSVLTSIATGLPEVEAGAILGSDMQTLYDTYDDFEFKKEQAEKWDELEKSVIASVADDVIVGVKGKRVDIVVIKRFA